jgi:hypothetical protein
VTPAAAPPRPRVILHTVRTFGSGTGSMPDREKRPRSPVRSLHVPSHVPSRPQNAAKVRGFSLTASGFTAETDWLLEERGFELLVPRKRDAVPITTSPAKCDNVRRAVSFATFQTTTYRSSGSPNSESRRVRARDTWDWNSCQVPSCKPSVGHPSGDIFPRRCRSAYPGAPMMRICPMRPFTRATLLLTLRPGSARIAFTS